LKVVDATDDARVEELVAAAVLHGGRAARVGEETLLAHRRQLLGLLGDLALACRRRGRRLALRAGRGGCLRLRSAFGSLSSRATAALLTVSALATGVAVGDGGEVAVRVRVAVDVADLDEAAQALVGAHADDAAVLGGDDRALRLRVDVDAAAVLGGLDRDRDVPAGRDALRGPRSR
jgi:hypothetical protein